MNRGALALAATGELQDDIAIVCGVSQVAVSHWLDARRRPAADKRALLRKRYKIPLRAWDVDVEVATAPHTTDAPAMPDGARAQAQLLALSVHRLLHEVEQDRTTSAQARARVMASCASTLRQIARITGEDVQPIVDEILTILRTTLRPWPEAAEAVAGALEQAAQRRPKEPT